MILNLKDSANREPLPLKAFEDFTSFSQSSCKNKLYLQGIGTALLTLTVEFILNIQPMLTGLGQGIEVNMWLAVTGPTVSSQAITDLLLLTTLDGDLRIPVTGIIRHRLVKSSGYRYTYPNGINSSLQKDAIGCL